MERSKGQKYKSRLGVITTVLLVVLLVYFAAQMFGKINTSVSVINTQFVTDDVYVSLGGYVYRNEELILAEADELADFTVRSGEKIPVGKEYMTVYKTNISGVEKRYMVQGNLNVLSDKIDSLRDGLDEELRVQDVSRVSSSLNSSYYSFISAVAEGNYSSADLDGESMLEEMNKLQIITGKIEALEDSANATVEEKENIISEYAVDSGRARYAERSCYVVRDVDGYEGVFSYADVMTMSVDDFKAQVDGIQKESNPYAVGKAVYDSKWYLVVPISQSNLNIFSAGSTYDVFLSELGGEKLSMNVERVEIAENKASGFAVLSSSEIGKSFEVSRYTGIKLLRSSVSGYRVPDEAIYSLDADDDGYTDYTGVYVMSGNYVKFRRINISSYGNGYVIVKSDDEAEEQFPYLSQNELIIVSGGNLYDGKLIK